MKSVILALALFVTSYSHAASQSEKYQEVVINWSATHLEESLVMQCDDTYLSGIDLIVPGELKSGNSFLIGNYIRYEDCNVNWKVSNIKIIDRNNQKYTSVRIEGGSECTIKVEQRVTYPQKPKYYTINIGDGC